MSHKQKRHRSPNLATCALIFKQFTGDLGAATTRQKCQAAKSKHTNRGWFWYRGDDQHNGGSKSQIIINIVRQWRGLSILNVVRLDREGPACIGSAAEGLKVNVCRRTFQANNAIRTSPVDRTQKEFRGARTSSA